MCPLSNTAPRSQFLKADMQQAAQATAPSLSKNSLIQAGQVFFGRSVKEQPFSQDAVVYPGLMPEERWGRPVG